MYRTAHIACITSRVGREKNNSGTPIGHVYLTSVHHQAKIHFITSCRYGHFRILPVYTHAAVLRLYFEVLKLLLGKLSLQVWNRGRLDRKDTVAFETSVLITWTWSPRKHFPEMFFRRSVCVPCGTSTLELDHL